MKRTILITALLTMVAIGATAQNERTGATYRRDSQTQTAPTNDNNATRPAAEAPAQNRGTAPQNPPAGRQDNRGTVAGNRTPAGTPPTRRPGEERIDDARRSLDNARRDFKDTKTQVRIDDRQAPAFPVAKDRRIEPRPEMRRPMPPRVRVFTREERILRTNADRIEVYTDFMSKAQAAKYIRDLLWENFYDVETFSQNYVTTALTEIPTGFMTSTLFSMRFTMTRTSRGIKITITSRWTESRTKSLLALIFQPDSNYATHYAWNVLEDIAYQIPNYRIVYR